MSDIKTFVDRRELAADRAEQIRLGLQSSAVLYAAAIAEEDWRTLSYASEKAWAEAEFSPDRFSTDNRKRLVSMYGAWGWSQRQIAAATGAAQSTIAKDQAEARDQNRSQETDNSDIPESARQRAAREREVERARQREAERRLAAEAQERDAAQRELEAARARQREAERLAAEARELENQRRREALAAAVKTTTLKGDTEGAQREIRKRVWAGKPVKRGEIAELFGVSEMFVRQTAAVEEAGYQSGTPTGRPKNWNGKSNDKRLRELQAEKRTTSYGELLEVQVNFAKMCVVLEAIHVQEYGLDDLTFGKVSEIYDDLVSLGEWYTRQLSAVQGYLGQLPARERIAKLRNVTGRTPEETATALRLADKLERSLENNLS